MILKLLAQLQKNLKKTFLGFKKNPQTTISKTVAKTVKTVAKTVIAKAKSLSQLKVFARIFTRTPPILKIKHPNPVNHVKPVLLTGNDYALGSSTSTCINSVTYPQDAIVLKNRDSNQEVVSRLHLTMRKEPKTGNYILKDERSQNGTYKLKFWRGLLTRLLQRPNERLNHQITLHDGDVISLSDPDFQDAVIIKYIYPPVWYIRGLWYGLWGLVWALILTFLLGCLAVWSVSDVIVNPIPSIPAPLAIYANDGKTLVSAGISTKHQPAERLLDFPPLLIKTLFASEDQNYYWHPGINPIRIVKSSFENLLKRDIISGASTITQQLARTLFSYEVNGKDIWGRKIKNYKAGETTDTLERKFREAGVALKLSLAYPKDALLLAYLNNIDLGYSNLGQGIRGFGDASDFYFAKSIRTMSPNNYEDVARVATVVALVRNPAYAYAVCDKEGKGASDRLAIIQFDDKASTIIKLTPATEIAQLKSAIEQLKNFSGGTNMALGLQQALKSLNTETMTNRRTILFTDGETFDEDDCLELVQEFGTQNIPITALGVGNDFNEDLLNNLSDAAGGRSFHIVTENPSGGAVAIADLPAKLVEEFGLAQQEVVTNLSLSAKTVQGVRLSRLMRAYPSQAEFSVDRKVYPIGNAAANDQTIFILEFVIDSRAASRSRIAQLGLTYEIPGENRRGELPLQNLVVEFVAGENFATAVNPDVMFYVQQCNIDKVIKEATKIADQDPQKAEQMLENARRMSEHIGNSDMIKSLIVAKDELHKTRRISDNTRKTIKMGSRGKTVKMSDSLDDDLAEAELRKASGT